jgi:hypothetical protein
MVDIPMALTLIFSSAAHAQSHKAVCFDEVFVEDYSTPVYEVAEMQNGKCPEDFEKVEWFGVPCRRLARFAKEMKLIETDCKGPRHGSGTRRRIKKR